MKLIFQFRNPVGISHNLDTFCGHICCLECHWFYFCVFFIHVYVGIDDESPEGHKTKSALQEPVTTRSTDQNHHVRCTMYVDFTIYFDTFMIEI